MIQNLSLAVDMTILLADNAFAEVHEVQMLNRAADARRAFEPAFLQIAVALWRLRQILSKRSWPQC